MGFALDKYGGSVVTKVVAKGAAASAGIKIGDRIKSVNGIDLSQLMFEETMQMLKAARRPVLLGLFVARWTTT